MKAYVTQKDISIDQGYGVVVQGTMYIPEAHIEIHRKYRSHHELQPYLRIQQFDAYTFRLVQSDPENLEEFEIDEEKIRDLLSKRDNIEQAEKNLEARLRGLYQNLSPKHG